MSQVLASEIKFYKSDSADSDGGDISANEIADETLNNVFDNVSGDDAAVGIVAYKKIFIKNTNSVEALDALKVWIEQLTDSEDDEIDISTCDTLTGSDATGDGQSYVRPNSAVHADVLDYGSVPAGDYVALWLRRTVDGGAAEYSQNSAIIGMATTYTL